MEDLTLDQVLARARTVIRDDSPLLRTMEASFGVTTQPGPEFCAAGVSQRC